MKHTAVTVGTFDGLHLGHVHLADTLRRLAAERGFEAVMLTFARHPLATLRPGAEPPLLIGRSPSALSLPGIRTEIIDFTPEIASLTAGQFMEMLVERFGARVLLTGFNNRLGSDGPADFSRYQRLGAGLGLAVEGATPFALPGGAVPSSSAIRRALLAAEPEKAAAMLGRAYTLSGVAVEGRHNGRKIGFPTINLLPDAGRLVPAPGVYAGRIDIADREGLPAVINVGHNPTVAGEGAPISVEGHALGARLPFEYGAAVRFHFINYLRAERRFAGLDELRRAIAADTARAITCLQES